MERFVLCIAIVFVTSCGALLGIKKIRPLKDEQIISTATNLGLHEENIFKIDTGKMKRFYLHLKTSDPRTYNEVFQPLQVISFLQDGSNSLYLVNCNVGGRPLRWNRFNTFDSFPLQQRLFSRPAVNSKLQTQLECLVPIKDPLPSISQLADKDEIIFVYWSAFMNKHASSLVSLVKEYVNRFPDKKIQVYWVNVDNLYL